ncbi:MAG: arsenite methyltransferase [Phycisphaerales bacterium]
MRTNEKNEQGGSCCGDDCCGGAGVRVGVERVREEEADGVREKVRAGYTKIAQSGSWSAAQGAGCCGTGEETSGGGCCGPTTFSSERLARAMGYGEELGDVPSGANMGLSCGNPTALASLRDGEVVLDLGAGGGFDCFVAGPRVGRTGRVIGVDMTAEMVSKARGGIAWYRERTGLDNVEFRLGEIENLPVADGSVDVVISNCVLNLSPDKGRVWREIARVLRVGGRVAVSDLGLKRVLPEEVRADVEALVGCVAGAELIEETVERARAAGLTEVRAEEKGGYVRAMEESGDPLYRRLGERLGAGMRVSDFVTSVDITARKG